MCMLQWTVIVLFFVDSLSVHEDKKEDLKCGNIESPNNTTCYKTKGDLHQIDNPDSLFPDNTIFFVETTCRGGLTTRQACAVESAAKAHPHRYIVVLFTGPVDGYCLQRNPLWILLSAFKNIHFARVEAEEFAKGTPLASLVASKAFKRSRYPFEHTSAVLKYLTLYKLSGVYLDLDVIVMKSFDSLPKNWVGKDYDNEVATGLIAISRDGVGRKMAKQTVRVLKKKFNPYMKDYNNVDVMKKSLQQICCTHSTDVENLSAHNCQGFEVFDRKYFYPVSSTEYKKLYECGYLDLSEAYAVHTYGSLAGNNVRVHEKSPYAYLAKKFCPKITQMDNTHFVEVKRTPMNVMTYILPNP